MTHVNGMTHMTKNWKLVISRILEESGSRNASLTGLTGKEEYELSMELSKKYILLLKEDIHSFVFSDGVIPPEGILPTEDHLENIDDEGILITK